MSSRLQRGSLYIVPNFSMTHVISGGGGSRRRPFAAVAAAATVFPNLLLRSWSPFLPKLSDITTTLSPHRQHSLLFLFHLSHQH
jgi:hypothetical protein